MSSQATQAGFTLLEVMIALAIVAVALVALLGLENRSIAVSTRQQMVTRATLLAQERLVEIEHASAAATIGEDQGVFAPPFAGFRWQVRYLATPLPQILLVEMTVAWGESRRNEEVLLTSFVRRPAGSP
jgi:general secretion pathway protein I